MATKKKAAFKRPVIKGVDQSARILAVVESFKPKVVAPKVTRPVIKKPEPPEEQTVFVDGQRRIFIFLSKHGNGKGYSRYLTVKDETLKVVKLEAGERARKAVGTEAAKRGEVGELLTQETAYVVDLIPLLKNGKPYPRLVAAKRFYDRDTDKTHEAVKALCEVLDMPVPEMTPEQAAKREAKVERMKKVREALTESRKEKAEDEPRTLMTPSGLPRSFVVVTLVKGVKVSGLDAPRAEVVALLKKAGGSLTISGLRKAAGGMPNDHSVMKLLKLGVVALT